MATTQAFQPVYAFFATGTWFEAGTRKELPNYDPTVDPARHAGMGMGGMGGTTGATPVYLVVTPGPAEFMMVAHSLVAALLGFVGAKFATYIRESEASGALR